MSICVLMVIEFSSGQTLLDERDDEYVAAISHTKGHDAARAPKFRSNRNRIVIDVRTGAVAIRRCSIVSA